MFKEFILKIKIRRAEKKLNKLLDLRDLHLDYKDIQDDIKKVLSELNNLQDNEFVTKTKKKIEKENLDPSIFKKCERCDQLYLKSEKHKCIF